MSMKRAADAVMEAIVEEDITQQRGNTVVSVSDDGNFKDLVIDRSLHINSIADALRFCGMPAECEDREGDTEWVVTDSRFGFNDVHMNLRSIGKVARVTNPNGWIRLRRRKLIPLAYEPVRPIELKITNRKQRPYVEPGDGTVVDHLVIPDPQFGFYREHNSDVNHTFHDRSCLSIILQILAYEGVDSATCLGDYYDLPMLQGKFPRGPELANMTQLGLIEGAFFAWKVRNILDANAAKKRRDNLFPFYIIEGNHDARIRKIMVENVAEASWLRPVLEPDGPPLLSIERAMNAKELQIELVGPYPDAVRYLNGNIGLMHGDRVDPKSGGTAMKYLRAGVTSSYVYGHIHRFEEVWLTTSGPEGQRERMAASPGCACRIDGAVPGGSRRLNWQQGCAKITTETGGREYFQYRGIRIQGGRALHDGKVFVGKPEEYREELTEWVRSVGWKNIDAFARSESM